MNMPSTVTHMMWPSAVLLGANAAAVPTNCKLYKRYACNANVRKRTNCKRTS
jgi:hypothetical protein